MKRALIVLVTIPMLLVAAACDQPSAQKEQPSAATSATPQVIADEDLAVPADFEEDASKTITVANYKTELDKLDAEIAN